MVKGKGSDIRKNNQPREWGCVVKKGRQRLHISLFYPNTYQVGMANLGFQAVYGLCNALNDVFCERVFLPSLASPAVSPKAKTLETGRPAADADILAFSLGFENDYPHVVALLHACKIPLLSQDRTAGRYPLVLGGGVAGFLNPEPMAPFFDAFLLGEAESVLPPFLAAWNPNAPMESQLRELAASMPSLYIPAFYTPAYNESGRLAAFTPAVGARAKITPAKEPDLTLFDTQSQLVVKDSAFGETFLIETGRGCPHGCRFCSAGAIYFPPRFRNLNQIKASIAHGLGHTNHIGLVGAAVSDFPNISDLCPFLEQLTDVAEARISFSSFRADAINDDFLRLLLKSGVKSATIAPEAGSQRMRNVINKDLTEEQILSAAQILAKGGILNLKLYFMIGLPFEEDEDVAAITDLCGKIQKVFVDAGRDLKRLGKIAVTISAFVPKPATPFQWCAMEPMAALKKKLTYLKKYINKIPNMSASGDASKQVLLQGVLSRADRRAAGLLLDYNANGGNLSQVLKNHKDLTELYLNGFAKDDLLPWDFLQTGRGKKYLWNQFEHARNAETTGFCPLGRNECNVCGHCMA